jgi:hypothetical protein
LDKAIGFFRATGASSVKEDAPTLDSATARAASIQAARIRYAEREEAKERKAEKEMLRAQDKANRKRQQREERQSRRSESSTGPGGVSAGSSEKLGLIGRAYDEYQPAHSRTLPAHVPTVAAASTDARAERHDKAEWKGVASSMKVRWLGFVAWFRTRLLRIRRKMTSKSTDSL